MLYMMDLLRIDFWSLIRTPLLYQFYLFDKAIFLLCKESIVLSIFIFVHHYRMKSFVNKFLEIERILLKWSKQLQYEKYIVQFICKNLNMHSEDEHSVCLFTLFVWCSLKHSFQDLLEYIYYFYLTLIFHLCTL